jgi:hypothetical protein
MKFIACGQSAINLKLIYHRFDGEDRSKIANEGTKGLFEALELAGWKKHSVVTFYLERVPPDAIEILTNANVFTLSHRNGDGVLTGTIDAFEKFVLENSEQSCSIQERTLANILHHTLKTQFGLFKDYTIKQLTDNTYTVVK